MYVEIRKAGFINKGAELMLLSAREAIKTRYPNAKLVIPPNHSATYENYAPLGFYPKVEFYRFRTQWGRLGFLLPKQIRKFYGLILDEEIDVVLDSAGFSYSDQWGTGSYREMTKTIRRWKRRGVTTILLPQALGPYNEPKNREAIKIIANNADMIYAREPVSYKHLTEVVGERQNIKMAPDFTCLLNGIIPENYDDSDKHICIVPNYRMIDKTSATESKAYLPFLINCANYLLKKQAKPFILVHEGLPDLKLAEEVSRTAGNIPIIKETDPLKIKGILGKCKGTIGSRFHGLVSALSQGVPSLATGWSHKYQMLFEDYEFSEGLLSTTDSFENITLKLDILINTERRSELAQTLLKKAELIKKQAMQMWAEIFQIIDSNKRLNVDFRDPT